MTSTNDGKDVKSNQTSGPKGKTYYIELYKSLDAALNAEGELSSRTAQLCLAWRRVHTLCLHSAPPTHPHLLAWIQRHTARAILQTEWQSPNSKDEHTNLTEALDAFIEECQAAAASRDGVSLPWESQLLQRAEWFKSTLSNPWGHPVLKVLLDPRGQRPTTEQILEWLKEERGVVFVARLRQLALSKCDDLALTLLTAVMNRVRACREPVSDFEIFDNKEAPPPEAPEVTFESILNAEGGFSDVWDTLTDMELVLLHKSDRSTRLIDLTKLLPLVNGYQLVERLMSRLESAPREKRLWKNAKDVAMLATQVMITRCMVLPVCAGAVRAALYWCARALVRLVPAPRLPKATVVLAAPASTARHLHTFATAVHAQQSAISTDLKPFVVELYVRAITFGMNELEKLKLMPEYEEKEARSTDQTLASWFIQLGHLLSSSARMKCECTLTAFSVHPSPVMYDRIKSAPPLPPVALDTQDVKKDETEPTSEFGSWANDSRSQTNFVKTSETLNMKQTQHKTNVLSTAIFNEGEALGLGAELCQDIIVLLSGPRVKTLSWDMDRELLLENCRAYMERTHGGTRALTTELKYLNLDPKNFQHLPEEEDDENDVYYGIEKGYEHLVELQEPQPEEIWEDAIFEFERTESASSSSQEDEKRTRKKKNKHPAFIPDSDSDPLSLVAEIKHAEKKERPHSKERSKESKKKHKEKHSSKAHDRRKKEAKEKKKERKKIEKQEKQSPGPMSSLLGLRVVNRETVTHNQAEHNICITDSDYDSQGKSSMHSEGNDPDILYDGQYSMDELKSPEMRSTDNINKNLYKSNELSIASGQVAMNMLQQNNQKPTSLATIYEQSRIPVSPVLNSNASFKSTQDWNQNIQSVREEVKRSITKLIQFRRQKAMEATTVGICPNQNEVNQSQHVNQDQQMNQGQIVNEGQRVANQNQSVVNQSQRDLNQCQNVETTAAALQASPHPTFNMASYIGSKVTKASVSGHYTQKPRHVPVTKNVLTSPSAGTPVSHLNNAGDGLFAPKDTCSRVQPFNPAHSRKTHPKLTPQQKLLNAMNNTVNQSNQDDAQKKQQTPNASSNTHLNSYEKFLKQMQKSTNAGLYGPPSQTATNEKRKEIKPISRVTPVVANVVKSEPKPSPQCAKPVVQQRKVENAPNTFARLSYMHKNKYNEKSKLCEHKANPSEVDPLQCSISAELDRRIADLSRSKAKYLQSKSHYVATRMINHTTIQSAKPKDPLRVDIPRANEPNSKIVNLKVHNPVISKLLKGKTGVTVTKMCSPNSEQNLQGDMSQTPTPKHSTLSEKDQEDILNLLTQQNFLNRPQQLKVGNLSVNKIASQTFANRSVNKSLDTPSSSTQNKFPIGQAITSNAQENISDTKTDIHMHIDGNTFFPMISNTTIQKTTELIQTKKAHGKAKEKTLGGSKNNVSETNKTQMIVMEENKSAKMYVPKPPVIVSKQMEEIKEQDWAKVLDALRAQKTPNRGPNALNMVLNRDSFDKACEKSHNLHTNSASDEKATKTATNAMIQAATSKPSTSTVPKLSSNQPVTKKVDLPKKENQIQTKKLGANNRLIIYPEVTKQTHQCKLQKEEDPFISGIKNSDYEILEELMDDDLRQEIGELSSDEESYRSLPVAAPKVVKNNTNTKINSTVMNKTIQAKSKPAINIASAFEIRAKIPGVNAPTVATFKVPDSKLHIISNEKVDIGKLPETLLASNVIRHLPKTITPKVQGDTINNNSVAASAHLAASTPVKQPSLKPNVFYTAQPLVQNVVLYDPYFEMCKINPNCVTVVNETANIGLYQPQFTGNISGQVLIDTVTIPTVNVTPATDVTINIAGNNQTTASNVSMQKSKAVPVPTTSTEFTEQTRPVSDVSLPDSTIRVFNNTNEEKLKAKSYITVNEMTPKQTDKSDLNVNKISERKVLSEVQEKLKVPAPEKIQTVKPKNQKPVECEKKNEASQDQDRLAKKRLAIMNREIHSHNYFPAIPLTYVPLNMFKNSEEKDTDSGSTINGNDKGSEKSVDKTSTDLQKADAKTCENTKENKDTRACRILLLRSDKSQQKVDETSREDSSKRRKSKVRLKYTVVNKMAEIEASDSEIAQKVDCSLLMSKSEKSSDKNVLSEVFDKKPSEVKKKEDNANIPKMETPIPTRVSKRILNKKIKKSKEKAEKSKIVREEPKEQQPEVEKKVKEYRTVEKKATKWTDKPADDHVEYIDIENEILGNKIPKVIKVDEVSNNKSNKSLKNKSDKDVFDEKNEIPLFQVNSKTEVITAEKKESSSETIDIPSSPEGFHSDAAPLSQLSIINPDSKVENEVTKPKNVSASVLHDTALVKESAVKKTESLSKDGQSRTFSEAKDDRKGLKNASVVKTDSAQDKKNVKKHEVQSKFFELVDDIESTINAITESTINSPLMETSNKNAYEDINASTEVDDVGLTSDRLSSSIEITSFDKQHRNIDAFSNNTKYIQCNKSNENTPSKINEEISKPEKVLEENSSNQSTKDSEKTFALNCNKNTVNKSIDKTKLQKFTSDKMDNAESEEISAPNCNKNTVNKSIDKTILQKCTNDKMANVESEKTSAPNYNKNTINESIDKTTSQKSTSDKMAKIKSTTANENTNCVTEKLVADPQIPQAYKDSIRMEEIFTPGNKDPNTRCFRIKLPNKKVFRATISGKVHVSIDTLFEDPALKNILLSGYNDKKRYTLSVQQISTIDNKVIDTRIHGIEVKNDKNKIKDNKNLIKDPTKVVETVNLISDDEDEPQQKTTIDSSTVRDEPHQKITTASGTYKIKPIDKETLNKHQQKLSQNCTIKLQKCDEKSKLDTLVNSLLEDLIILPKQNTQEVPKSNEKSIETEDILDVIELDDSSNEVGTTEIQVENKLDELKNLLLQELGVADIVQCGMPNSQQEYMRPSCTRKSEPLNSENKLKDSIDSENELKSSTDVSKHENDPKIRHDCYVKLVNCDYILKCYKNISREVANDSEVITCDKRYDTPSVLSRSGSFSILNDLEVFNGEIAPVINVNETIIALQPTSCSGRNSPVMEVFDMIVTLQESAFKAAEKSELTSVEQDLICESEWFMTKRDLYSQNVANVTESVFEIINSCPYKNDTSTDCDTDVTDLSFSLLDCDNVRIETSIVPSLISIMSKYFEDNPIVNQLTASTSRTTWNTAVPVSLKRKLSDQDKSTSYKLIKVSDFPITDNLGETNLKSIANEVKEQNDFKTAINYGKDVETCNDFNQKDGVQLEDDHNEINTSITSTLEELPAVTETSNDIEDCPSPSLLTEDFCHLPDLCEMSTDKKQLIVETQHEILKENTNTILKKMNIFEETFNVTALQLEHEPTNKIFETNTLIQDDASSIPREESTPKVILDTSCEKAQIEEESISTTEIENKTPTSETFNVTALQTEYEESNRTFKTDTLIHDDTTSVSREDIRPEILIKTICEKAQIEEVYISIPNIKNTTVTSETFNLTAFQKEYKENNTTSENNTLLHDESISVPRKYITPEILNTRCEKAPIEEKSILTTEIENKTVTSETYNVTALQTEYEDINTTFETNILIQDDTGSVPSETTKPAILIDISSENTLIKSISTTETENISVTSETVTTLQLECEESNTTLKSNIPKQDDASSDPSKDTTPGIINSASCEKAQIEEECISTTEIENKRPTSETFNVTSLQTKYKESNTTFETNTLIQHDADSVPSEKTTPETLIYTTSEKTRIESIWTTEMENTTVTSETLTTLQSEYEESNTTLKTNNPKQDDASSDASKDSRSEIITDANSEKAQIEDESFSRTETEKTTVTCFNEATTPARVTTDELPKQEEFLTSRILREQFSDVKNHFDAKPFTGTETEFVTLTSIEDVPSIVENIISLPKYDQLSRCNEKSCDQTLEENAQSAAQSIPTSENAVLTGSAFDNVTIKVEDTVVLSKCEKPLSLEDNSRTDIQCKLSTHSITIEPSSSSETMTVLDTTDMPKCEAAPRIFNEDLCHLVSNEITPEPEELSTVLAQRTEKTVVNQCELTHDVECNVIQKEEPLNVESVLTSLIETISKDTTKIDQQTVNKESGKEIVIETHVEKQKTDMSHKDSIVEGILIQEYDTNDKVDKNNTELFYKETEINADHNTTKTKVKDELVENSKNLDTSNTIQLPKSEEATISEQEYYATTASDITTKEITQLEENYSTSEIENIDGRLKIEENDITCDGSLESIVGDENHSNDNIDWIENETIIDNESFEKSSYDNASLNDSNIPEIPLQHEETYTPYNSEINFVDEEKKENCDFTQITTMSETYNKIIQTDMQDNNNKTSVDYESEIRNKVDKEKPSTSKYSINISTECISGQPHCEDNYVCQTEIFVEEVSGNSKLNRVLKDTCFREPCLRTSGRKKDNTVPQSEESQTECVRTSTFNSCDSNKIVVEKSIGELDENILECNATLVYKDDSGVILKGIEYEDPEIGTCFVFPIDSNDVTEASQLLNESVESTIEVINDGIVTRDEITSKISKKCDPYSAFHDETDLHVLEPKRTYSKRHLKRKSDMKDVDVCNKRPRRNSRVRDSSDIKIPERKYRKGKNIDLAKLSRASVFESSYTREFKRLLDYQNTIDFSYTMSFSNQYIDVPNLIKNWPIKGSISKETRNQTEASSGLFVDAESSENLVRDPMHLTLVEEITAEYNDEDYTNDCETDKTSFNMGFGEGSGRVKQNLDGGAISKFSAATLSDVKQSQPFLQSKDGGDSGNIENFLESSKRQQIQTIKRFFNYVQLRDKVRSFFKNTAIELACGLEREKSNDKKYYDESLVELYNAKYIEPNPFQAVVQVVQVGQLPVSAAAQNPVTCDPRVTQVSDASPSQCSAENSPHDDSQPEIKTEYTELTTAEMSMPMVGDYMDHNQTANIESQETNLSHEDIPIKTEIIKSEVKIEIVEETDEKERNLQSCEESDMDNHVNNVDYLYDTNNTNTSVDAEFQALFGTEKEDPSVPIMEQKQQNGSTEKTDQIAHAMNAAGITTSSETVTSSQAQALVNLLSQKMRQGVVTTSQNSINCYPKTTSINTISLQQALAQILPPPLNQTNTTDNNQQGQNQVAPVLHIVQGKNAAGNQITLVDNSQQSVIATPNATPVLHIVQNKAATTGPTHNGGSAPQSNAFSGISLVDAGLQQGGNQLLHIVNTGTQNKNSAGQLLKRVNLLTNLTNVQGSNEQKMVQFVCKSADGKSIQLNAPHQRSMVLRLQPIETPNIQTAPPKPADNQDMSPTPNTTNSVQKEPVTTQQEIKSRSVYEENYAKFIQNSSNKSSLQEKSTSLPKFNQAFGKQVYQDGKQNDTNSNNSHISNVNTTDNSECQPTDNSINLDHIGQISSPPLLLRKSPQSSQAQTNLVQQIKQTIAPMNIQTMHGGVIYTRQIPVNIGAGQTINLITVPSTELIDESGQKQQVNQGEIEPSIIKIVPQSQPNADVTSDDMNVAGENGQNPPQPQQVLTQMRIKLPMLSKNPQMVAGTRVVRPSFFQIQRNVIAGTNQPVYQQLVLTAAPPLGQQTIRLPQAPARQIKVPESQSSSESQMSSSTLEQLREFDMVLEQVKERSTVQPNSNSSTSYKIHTTSTDTTDSTATATSTTTETTQVLYSIGGSQPLNVAYVNRKTTITTPTTSSFTRSPDSSGIADSPSSSTHVQIPQTATTEASSSETVTPQPKPAKVSSKKRHKSSSHSHSNSMKMSSVPPKTSTQKPLEDEQTTQRILYILAEYKEQVENSPDKDKPAPRRRSNPPTNPSGSSKRKKSSSGSRRSGGRDVSPVDDSCRTMGSEDSSCGTSQGDCTENCLETHSPQDSPRKVARKLNFEQETNATVNKPQPQRNVIVADGQTITVARGTAGKPATAVLMPANYILPVSMVKGGQQIAIVTNRGPKLLTVGGGEGGATNTLLLQRLIGPAGLKPVLARPGVRHVRLPTAALHNLQAFNLATTATTVQPPDSTASPATESTPPELVDTRAEHSPWADRESEASKPERASSPDDSEPWNLPSSADTHDYTYEETVRADHMDRTVLDPIQDRYSPDMEAQRIFDKMFDVDTKKSYIVDSPRCGYDIDASDCDDKPYQVVQKKDSSQRQARLAHVSAAALRHKYAILEHELRLQKSLSEECEDLGVDSPSASELFPEAELLFATSPAQDHGSDTPHTPQTIVHNQSGIQADIDDQIATDQLLPRSNMVDDRQEIDVNLGLEDVGIVTVSEDGMQATIALDQEEFARSHPNTTFHSEPTDEGEVQPFTISGLKTRHITSTIFHANRAPATVLMTAPQTTVISQATVDGTNANPVKYSDIDNMINSLPGPHTNTINLSSVLVKDDGLTRFDSILTDSRELHLSNTASAIVHSTGSATQVIRRVCYDDDSKRERDRLFLDEPDALIAGEDAKMLAEDSSRDATMESMADVDDDNSSPERHAELFWESNSASERSESRRPMDFSSDSEKCCKSPSYDETNSTDSSGVGTHMRLDSVIKEARGRDRSGSADGSSADDTHPPLRTYPAKRLYHSLEGEMERSLSGKTRAGERSPDSLEVRRRASVRGVVKRGCHCCNGSPAPPRPKKPRQRKPTMDFTAN